MSDRVTFTDCAKKSRQQKVTLVENITFMSHWYVSKSMNKKLMVRDTLLKAWLMQTIVKR